MVSIKKRALKDLQKLFNGLLKWSVKTNTKNNVRENHMSREHVKDYCDKILDVCYELDSKVYHAPARYFDHRRYGKYVYNYTPSNKRTNIYIIYDINKHGVILINKITTNYKTISGF